MTTQIALTKREQTSLAKLEKVIDEGIDSFVAVIMALATIREERLYRATHKRFEDYCKERFPKLATTRQRFNQLASAGEVYRDVETSVSLAPVNETQLRPLVSLSNPQQRQEVWSHAVNKSGGRQPTAREVEEAKQEVAAAIWKRLTPEQQAAATKLEEERAAKSRRQMEARTNSNDSKRFDRIHNLLQQCLPPIERLELAEAKKKLAKQIEAAIATVEEAMGA